MPAHRSGACRSGSRRSGTFAVLTALAVLAAACSGDDGGALSTVTPTTSPGTAPVSTAAPATTSTLAPVTTAPPVTSGPVTTVPATAVPTTAAPATNLTNWPCPDFVPAGASCHRLSVPADWGVPDPGETVSLPIVVLPARTSAAEPSAIVIPAGGPGFEQLRGSEFWSTSAFNEAHDIVLYDQRGTGLAEPNLECPERDEAWVANLQQQSDFATERAAMVVAMLACRARLQAAGAQMADYDTEASVQDLDAIREALGYAQWNLLGISYGARLSLAAMRSTPDGIRSAILDSVYDVTAGGLAATIGSANRSIGALVAACEADPSCNEKYPNLIVTIETVRTMYNTTPAEVDIDLGDGAGVQHWVITGDDIMAGLFQALYDASIIPVIPAIIFSASVGDLSILPEFIRRGIPFGTGQADAMTASVDCADNAGLDNTGEPDVLANPGPWFLIAADIRCDEWGVPATSVTFNQPVVSDIPALVLAGAFDPVTPPDRTEAVAARLPNATFALWANQGHAVTGEPCAVTIELAFLVDPSAEVDTSCAAAIGPPAFA